jgi:hypothetical protein
MFKFRAVLTHCQPFLSGSVRERATSSDPNAEKWSISMQFAVRPLLLMSVWANYLELDSLRQTMCHLSALTVIVDVQPW